VTVPFFIFYFYNLLFANSFISLFNTQTMHIKSIILTSIAMFYLKTSYPDGTIPLTYFLALGTRVALDIASASGIEDPGSILHNWSQTRDATCLSYPD
jgi:hypothetical protein